MKILFRNIPGMSPFSGNQLKTNLISYCNRNIEKGKKAVLQDVMVILKNALRQDIMEANTPQKRSVVIDTIKTLLTEVGNHPANKFGRFSMIDIENILESDEIRTRSFDTDTDYALHETGIALWQGAIPPTIPGKSARPAQAHPSISHTVADIRHIKPTRRPIVDSRHIPDELRKDVDQACKKHYLYSTRIMETSIGDVAMRYVHADADITSTEPGPLLNLSRELSQKYLDLLEAYSAYEESQDIAIIPPDAGQMKMHGFNSKQIIEMQPGAQKFMKIIAALKELFPEQEEFDQHFSILTDKKKRQAYPPSKNDFFRLIEQYERMDDHALYIDQACFLMHDFAHMDNRMIEQQLRAVADMNLLSPAENIAKLKALSHGDSETHINPRLLMEIAHRVSGDGTVRQTGFGSLGDDPEAYMDVLLNGEPENMEAEYRNRMYFVYMLNHFANTIMSHAELQGTPPNRSFTVVKDPEKIAFINSFLANKYSEEPHKSWELDTPFIDQLMTRGPNYLPKLFVYGSAAAKNPKLRTMASDEDLDRGYFDNPSPRDTAVDEGIEDPVAYQRVTMSEKEKSYHGSIRYATGAFLFSLKSPFDIMAKTEPLFKRLNEISRLSIHQQADPTIQSERDWIESELTTFQDALEYLEEVEETGQLVLSGISGTLDQSIRMANIVGIGLDDTPDTFHLMKLAYLALMIPNLDHSVHEIMASSRSFGMEYVSGPAYEQYIYPPDEDRFISLLEAEQKHRGEELPSRYLQSDYATEISERLTKGAPSLSFNNYVSILRGVDHKYIATRTHPAIIDSATSQLSRLFSLAKIDRSVINLKGYDYHTTLCGPTQELDHQISTASSSKDPFLKQTACDLVSTDDLRADITWQWDQVAINPDTGALLLLSSDAESEKSFQALGKRIGQHFSSRPDDWKLHVTLGYINNTALSEVVDKLSANNYETLTIPGDSEKGTTDSNFIILPIRSIEQKVVNES
jgi:hypothetical protein